MNATLYSIGSLPEKLVLRWNELLATLVLKSAFLSYSFCTAVERVRGGVFVLHIQTADGAEGFLPFQHTKGRRLFGHAAKVGGSLADYFGVIGNIQGALDVAELLRSARLSALRFDHAVPQLCPFIILDKEVAFGVRLQVATFQDFTSILEKRNKKFLSEVRRGERRLEALGPLEFEWHSRLNEVGELIDSKRQQYQRTGSVDALGAIWHQRLLRELAATPSSPSCEVIFSRLLAGGVQIASHLGLRCHDTFHFWFPVYSLHLRRYSPGHILFFKMIEQASQEGVVTFDFGEGVSHYKMQYQGEVYELSKGVIRLDSLAGRVEGILQSLSWRLHDLPRFRFPVARIRPTQLQKNG